MKFRNFPMVPRVCFGRGSFAQVNEIIEPKRQGNAPFIYFIDNVFNGQQHLPMENLELKGSDEIIFVDVEPHEPTTWQVDELRYRIKSTHNRISGIVGIGGGATMDIAKAVSLMMTNDGSSQQYQGWDLVKKPGVYHVGIPTLSGTGAEVSRTAVLVGPEKKLGLNSDFTPFDQVILDPALTKDVPMDQRFYTGMDNYLHCVESLTGTFLNTFSKSYGEKAFEMCRHVFLEKDVWDDDSDDELMMASWHGGMSIAYSQVGIVHATAYGISFALGVRHGVGNCIVFNQLEEFYPEEYKEFRAMIDKWEINLPKGICANATEEQFNDMVRVSYSMTPLWENAFGKDWQKIITPEKLRELFERM